ncbi:spore germination protein YaaH [Paenibacillus shirakamiensis]|uniref:Spore germination protein YaaH n=1 Tax=Paenibacillus shirakamiensis TaxID=1265935 RepID=A0ABS4JER0_9BACL|nr:spore germination protein YaaH [Paenibacillus shirakamiensis]
MQKNSKIVLDYYTQDEIAYPSLTHNYSYLSQISTDSYTLDAEGEVMGTAPSAAVAFANKKKIQTYAAVSNWQGHDFSPELAHQIISVPKVKKATIANLLQVVKSNGFKGINIDFESVAARDRKAFSSFTADVATAMKARGYLTMISVPAKFTDDPSNDWDGAFDFKALGKCADYIQVMTYDQHGPWGEPGPVAGKDWVGEALQYAVSAIPASKVIMGIASYGYDWNVSKHSGTTVGLKDIPTLVKATHAVPLWDKVSFSMHFDYQDPEGSDHVVWYENAASIQEKTHDTLTYHIAGVSIWSMGTEDQEFFKAMAAGLK